MTSCKGGRVLEKSQNVEFKKVTFMNPNLLAWDLTPFSNYTMGKLQPPINFNLKIKIAGKFSQRYISPIYLCLASPLLCQRAPNVLSAVTKPSTEN